MLKDLLRVLADERPYTTAELAARLHCDTAEVRRAFEHCERAGYLERVVTACGDCCDGCPSGNSGGACCPPSADDGPETAPSWWRVTDSGLRAARLTAVRPARG
jgi:hypothetical protein